MQTTQNPSSHGWTVSSEADMVALGRRWGLALMPGLVFAVEGSLGAGKTRLAKGMASGLEIPPEEISSPTFGIIHCHEGRLPFFHLDAYRLKSSDEFVNLGGLDAFESGGVAFVEWASRLADLLPPDRIDVSIDVITPEERRVCLRAGGPFSTRWLASVLASPDSPMV